jgi:hypothetical protein
MTTELIRICSGCGKQKSYKNKLTYKIAESKGSQCAKCAQKTRKDKEDAAIQRFILKLREKKSETNN